MKPLTGKDRQGAQPNTGDIRFASEVPDPDPHNRPVRELAAAYLRGAVSVLPQMLIVPRLPSAVIRTVALRRLRKTVEHAKARVPFYQRHLRDVDPDQLVALDAITAIPPLTKTHLRDHADSIQPLLRDRPRLQRRSSSGSSGVPVHCYFDPLLELPRRFQELRFLSAHGMQPWFTQLVFDHYDHMAPKRFLPQKLGLWRREIFPWWTESRRAVNYVNQMKPEILAGVLSSLRMLALCVRDHGGLRYRPRLAATKGELLDPATRALIENNLGCPLVDYYATEEAGIIAWQCPSGNGYHIDQDWIHLEVVGEDGSPAPPGEMGEIVITNLYQRAMPIIRYRTGDLGRLSLDSCPCGRGLPLLTHLVGRTLDLIVTPSKEVHHPFSLVAIMEETTEGVERFRIEQQATDRLIVRLNWAANVDSRNQALGAKRIHSALSELLGDEVTIELSTAEDLSHGYGVKSPLVRGIPGLSLSALSDSSYMMKM